MAQDKFNLKGLDAKIKAELAKSMVLIGNTAKNHFVKSFRDGGFEDKTIQKWQPRKKETKRSRGKGVLINRGFLFKSIRMEANRSNLSAIISTNRPYARIHNEGLQGKAFGKHSFKMPKRQFIGDSFSMNEKIKKVIYSAMDKGFKK